MPPCHPGGYFFMSHKIDSRLMYGAVDITGQWFPNPCLEMSCEEQRRLREEALAEAGLIQADDS